MCDVDCAKYGDCCSDAKYFGDKDKQQRAKSQFRCIDMDKIELSDGISINSFYQKDRCLPNWEDSGIREKCENFVTGDPFLMTPVTNVNSNTTYGNIYCAYCNEDASQSPQLMYWGWRVNFGNNAGSECKPDSGTRALSYNESIGTWQIKCQDEIYESYHLIPQPPAEITSRIRSCIITRGSVYSSIFVKVGTSYTVLFGSDILENTCRDNRTIDRVLQKQCKNYSLSETTATFQSYSYFSILTDFGIIISIICLFIHLIVFSILKELHNLPGKNLASLCFSLLIAYFSFAMNIRSDHIACVINALVIYYFHLAAFTWMLVLAYDAWRTLRSSRVISGTQWKRFAIYSLGGWIFPGIMVIVVSLLQFYPPNFVNEEYKPHFGGQKFCWFTRGPSLFVFFVLPLAVIMVLNAGFFISAVRLTYSIGKKSPNQNSNRKRDLRLYIRLAIIMGLTWIPAIVVKYVDRELLWVLFTVMNTLLGLYIFFAFTCRRKILRSIQVKLPKIFKKHYRKNEAGGLTPVTASTCTQTAESSEHCTHL